jgi:hypothetical protein
VRRVRARRPVRRRRTLRCRTSNGRRPLAARVLPGVAEIDRAAQEDSSEGRFAVHPDHHHRPAIGANITTITGYAKIKKYPVIPQSGRLLPRS